MFGTIKNMFVEIENSPESIKEPETTAEAEPEPTAAAPAPVTPAPAPVAAPPKVVIPSAINEEMADFLSGAIEAANIDGFDYIEFRNSLVTMASIPMSEQQKFQATFATACSMGLTKAKLIDSINHYQGILEEKKAEFLAHVEEMIATEVTTREQLKTQKEQEIANLSEQIQQATAAIAEKQQEILGISNEINEESLRIKQTSSSFDSTFNFVSGKLQEDKGKIEMYLADVG